MRREAVSKASASLHFLFARLRSGKGACSGSAGKMTAMLVCGVPAAWCCGAAQIMIQETLNASA